MATEVENPPTVPAVEEKKEEAPAEVEATPAAVEESAEKPAEEAKEAPKEAAKEPAPKKPNVFKQNFEKDVVYLYQFARTTSLPSLSPYVLKVETWLRLSGLKYEVSLTFFYVSFVHFLRFQCCFVELKRVAFIGAHGGDFNNL